MDVHKELVKQEFTKQAHTISVSSYHNQRSVATSWAVSELEKLAKPTDHFLEVAAGPCIISRAISSKVAHVTAIDITPEMIKVGQEKATEEGVKNISFKVEDAEHISFSDNSFDAVFTRWTFHHMQHWPAVLKQMTRVCKPGGYIIVLDIESPSDKTKADRFNDIERLRDPSHAYFPVGEELLKEFQVNKLNVVKRSDFKEDKLVEAWFNITQTSTDNRKKVLEAFTEEINQSAAVPSGMHPFYKDNQLNISHQTFITVGQK